MIHQLDRIFCCKTCKASFIFEADKDDHIHETGHPDFETFDLIGSQLTVKESLELNKLFD